MVYAEKLGTELIKISPAEQFCVPKFIENLRGPYTSVIPVG